MDQALLVEQQIDDGQELIDLLVSDGFDVSAAAWVKPSEEDRWLLYLVSKQVDDHGLAAAFRAVHPVAGKLHSPWISLTELKLVGPTDPVAADIMEINRKYPGRTPTRTRRPHLGGMSIDEAYVYPVPGRMAPWFEKMKRTYPTAEALAVPVPSADLDLPALGAFMGRVNAAEFLGKPPGTVMFVGPEGKSGRAMAKLHFVYRPEGWNTLLNPQTQRWEEVRFADSGQPLYQPADFTSLLRSRSKNEDRMHRDSHLLALFRAALTGDSVGLHAFCDALEENTHPLAPFAREVGCATADVPADLEAVYEPAFLSRGTNWRIEYRPGRRAKRLHPDFPLMQGGQNAEVGEVYEGDGPWTDLDGVSTMLAPAGGRVMPTTLSALQERVTADWVRLAFDVVRLNMIGHLLVGHQVAMELPGQNRIMPVIPAIDHRINWLQAQGR